VRFPRKIGLQACLAFRRIFEALAAQLGQLRGVIAARLHE
jgi:hypothetical protein